MLQQFEEIKTITDILIKKHRNLQDDYLTYAERDILMVSLLYDFIKNISTYTLILGYDGNSSANKSCD